ncbi:hypothetical protein [Thermoleptolyngbya sp. M55_K2018_002]|nr:hypothetical protein [Thermoleptolyngbya sp. M55_K2018_002]
MFRQDDWIQAGACYGQRQPCASSTTHRPLFMLMRLLTSASGK